MSGNGGSKHQDPNVVQHAAEIAKEESKRLQLEKQLKEQAHAHQLKMQQLSSESEIQRETMSFRQRRRRSE